eukprot:TRINITY_DN10367_c0_g1_i1.p1 TRINITY_DN10367_c0_g1~~TRINITY_DN10367_c0_g1_i1.p1  ORF type:complete len:442 (+),score=63.75 TRINITY_DN10367_c0_g1_i1:261-1586(+)
MTASVTLELPRDFSEQDKSVLWGIDEQLNRFGSIRSIKKAIKRAQRSDIDSADIILNNQRSEILESVSSCTPLSRQLSSSLSYLSSSLRKEQHDNLKKKKKSDGDSFPLHPEMRALCEDLQVERSSSSGMKPFQTVEKNAQTQLILELRQSLRERDLLHKIEGKSEREVRRRSTGTKSRSRSRSRNMNSVPIGHGRSRSRDRKIRQSGTTYGRLPKKKALSSTDHPRRRSSSKTRTISNSADTRRRVFVLVNDESLMLDLKRNTTFEDIKRNLASNGDLYKLICERTQESIDETHDLNSLRNGDTLRALFINPFMDTLSSNSALLKAAENVRKKEKKRRSTEGHRKGKSKDNDDKKYVHVSAGSLRTRQIFLSPVGTSKKKLLTIRANTNLEQFIDRIERKLGGTLLEAHLVVNTYLYAIEDDSDVKELVNGNLVKVKMKK